MSKNKPSDNLKDYFKETGKELHQWPLTKDISTDGKTTNFVADLDAVECYVEWSVNKALQSVDGDVVGEESLQVGKTYTHLSPKWVFELVVYTGFDQRTNGRWYRFSKWDSPDEPYVEYLHDGLIAISQV
jgi:hypothetical protein